ncbi:GNAT family N-acetyltransferase [Microbacterium hydrocarbonoxydans]|uniref:GNAT family N-acetyltransferase n=1 Tax=Microbacterium hydrocarbonoxydans TaxID=273678 RepID=UPI00203EAA5C|nr:GNAT family N-acetyltransferase [Microbacterium hydrocarbonoxydans]MCM3781083.1 GNAT family N-acetyltransferase [Microbacterium hydrocarbonoxydans]
MVTITTEVATTARWDDVQRALTGGGDGASCQCIWPMLRNKDWNETTTPERVEMFRAEIDAGPSPGLIAYVDGEAAGWIRIGPRPLQRRLAHTRAIVAATHEPFDDDSVWAVSCFVVRREHRGKGLNRALLDAAVEYARGAGARIIEGYPVDTGGASQRSNELFHGTLSTFVAAGFEPRGELKAGRPLVTLDMAS